MADIIQIPSVAHIGTMDRRLKRPDSHEGSGLSVSTHPVSWMSIHCGAAPGFILTGRGRFLDAFSLDDDDKASIKEWAKSENLIEEREIWCVSYTDAETDELCTLEFSDFAAADAEAVSYDTEPFRLLSTAALPKLGALSGRSPSSLTLEKLPSSLQLDLALVLWAERDEDIDGVWWSHPDDPDTLSAPRGVIFDSRLRSWSAEPVFEFCAFELFQETLPPVSSSTRQPVFLR